MTNQASLVPQFDKLLMVKGSIVKEPPSNVCATTFYLIPETDSKTLQPYNSNPVTTMFPKTLYQSDT